MNSDRAMELRLSSIQLDGRLLDDGSKLEIHLRCLTEEKEYRREWSRGDEGLDTASMETIADILEQLSQEAARKGTPDYVMGEKLRFENQSQNFLIVERGGKIYFQWVNTFGNRQRKCQKSLTLHLVGSLDREVMLGNKIIVLENKCEALQKKQKSMEDERNNTIQTIADISTRMESLGDLIIDLSKDITKIRNQISVLKLNKSNSMPDQGSFQIKGEVNQLEEGYTAIVIELDNIKMSNAKMVVDIETLKEKLEAVQKTLVLQKIMEIIKDSQNKKEGRKEQNYEETLARINREPVDKSSKHIKGFKIEGTKITRQAEDLIKLLVGWWYVLLMLPVIDPKKKFSFKFKIIKSGNGHIFIGITDKMQGDQDWSGDLSYQVSYLGGKAETNPQKKQQGKGFKQNDVVETVVDLKKNEVQWLVNGKKEATSKGPLKGSKFVPFIVMRQPEDTVEWQGCKYYD